MKKISYLVIPVLLLLLTVRGYSQDEVTITSSDRTDLGITIYNNNIGLVHDTRNITLRSGEVTVRFLDVPSSMIAESVQFTGIGDIKDFTALEQNYTYDLISPQKLIDRYTGKQVRLEFNDPKSGDAESVTATIVSNRGGPVLQIGDEITFDHSGRIYFPELPEGLTTVPILSWLIESETEGTRKIRVSYLTHNISWRADYSLLLDEWGTTADLSGWITVDNRTGTDFENVKMRFLAGQINLEGVIPAPRLMAEKVVSQVPSVKERQFFEYHLYDIQRRTSIENNQKKQIRLLDTRSVSLNKRFIVRGATEYYYSQYRKGTSSTEVGVYFEMLNDRKNNLGIPLPEGLARVYKRDEPDTFVFIGEDRIGHTPENETVKIKTGRAFDIVAERKQTDWVRIAEGVFETTLEVIVRNQKDEDVMVTVVEPVPGDWRVIETSHDFRKTTANEAEFDISVPSKKEGVLRYRIRVIL